MDFLHALANHGFLQYAFVTGLLASVACGMIGTFVLVKRISFISGGIAHAVLAGMGIATFLSTNVLHGAIVAAIIAALIIGWVKLHVRQHEDTLIGAIWAVGMAIGILFLYKTPGYSIDLLSYLFGNILMVTRSSVLQLVILDATVLVILAVFFKYFVAVSFDEEFARIQGLSVDFWYLLLLCMIALTVVILVQVVGIVLVIALLTLPAAVAGQWSNTILRMMGLAVLAAAAFTCAGLFASFQLDLPSGATIVLIAATGFLISSMAKGFR